MRKAYQTDLSDAEWSCLELHLPATKADGRPRLHHLREILDAIFYVVRSGCAWRLLPHDFPPWKTVYHYFRSWRLDGTWERMHTALRKRVRVRLERDPQPSAAIVDSQSVKTTGVLLLDPSSHDRLPRLSHLWLDAGYTGEGKGADWVQKVVGWTAEIVRHPPKLVPDEVMRRWVMEWAKEGIAIDMERFSPPEGPRPFLPKRWIVERTFSWLGQNRRMSKDYERLPETGEAFVYVAMSRLMVRRLARR
jgi:putative transposase